MSARLGRWRVFLSWSCWPWYDDWWPRRLACKRWWKLCRFPGPCNIRYASLSFGYGHIWATLEKSR